VGELRSPAFPYTLTTGVIQVIEPDAIYPFQPSFEIRQWLFHYPISYNREYQRW